MTKEVRRFTTERWQKANIPDGHYVQGMMAGTAESLGQFISQFAYLEMEMTGLLSAALGDTQGDIGPAVWVSHTSNVARQKLLKILLAEHPRAAKLDVEADHILAEFGRLNEVRNGYVHGLWHYETARHEVWLTPKLKPNGDHWMFQSARLVGDDELRVATEQAFELSWQAQQFHREWIGRQE